MDFNEYQAKAMAFRAQTADQFYAVLGLAEEAGEVAGKVAKAIRDGVDQEVLREQLKKELGDVLWMVSAVAIDNGLTLQEIADHNIEKLTDRKARSVIHGQGDAR